jgi:hypothetical protein
MFKRFSGKPVYTEDPGLFWNQLINLYPCATIHLGLWQFKKPPDFFSFFPEVPPPFWTVPVEVKRAARLTGGEGGPAKGGVGSGKSLRSRRGTARRRWWPDLVDPRAKAGELVGGGCSGLFTTIQFNPRAREASQEAKESTRARNWRKAHRGGWSTFVGARVKSGDLDLVSPARQSSIPRSGSFTEARRVYLEGRTELGMARLAGLRWWVFGGRWHAVRRANTGDLALRRGRERAGAYGWSLGWLYRRGRGQWHELGLARRRARGVGRWACSGEFRVRRTRGGVLLPLFKSLLRSQTCESWQKSGADLFLAPRAVSCMWVPMADMP